LTRDLYALLGVAPDENAEIIAEVCARKLAEAPDHNAKVVLRHAREVLCNPVSRSAYDTRLREQSLLAVLRDIPFEPTPSSSLDGFRHSRLVFVVLIGLLALGLVAWIMAKTAKTAAITSKSATFVVVEQARGMQTTTPSAPSSTTVSVVNPETLYASTAPSVVVVESLGADGQPYGRGSGVVIGPQSVITNCHVIDRAIGVKIKSGASEFAATSGTSDTYLDLCVLQVEGLSAPEVRRGSVKNLQVGQTVYAIGAPQGLDRTLSQGLISALRETPDGTVIQTSAAISPGSSGGGLFDAEGRLIGITTFQTKLGQNLNFALPVDWLESMRTR
jgi:S1-C subfamily serine protease